jgi:hypothetical protein
MRPESIAIHRPLELLLTAGAREYEGDFFRRAYSRLGRRTGADHFVHRPRSARDLDRRAVTAESAEDLVD